MEKAVKPPVACAVDDIHRAAAEKLMKRKNVEQVWLCEKTGQWFTQPALAESYARSAKVTLKNYKNGD